MYPTKPTGIIIFIACVIGMTGNLLTAQNGKTVISKNDYITLKSVKPGEYIYELQFPDPQFETVSVNGKTFHKISAPFFESISQPGAPELPKLTYLLELPEGNPSVSVIQSASKRSRVHNILPHRDHAALVSLSESSLSDASTTDWKRKNEWNPANSVHLRFLGHFREIPMYRLDIYPYRYHAVKEELEALRTMSIRIVYPSNKKVTITEPISGDLQALLKTQIINWESAGKNRIWQSKKNLYKENLQANYLGSTYIKITLNKDGLYKITYDDLKRLMPFKSIDPRSFRLICQGREVPIYFKGEADGVFSSGDYFEFFGEQYRSKFHPYLKDIPSFSGHYYDLWSDENVYFLTWDGPPGQRLIEENAGLRQDTNLLRPPFYTVTRHFEEDRVRSDQIKNINLIQPAVIEDIWTFDDGVSYIAGGSNAQSTREYKFNIENPDNLFQRVDTLVINFQGISNGLHYIQVFVNDVLLTPTAMTWSGANKFQAALPVFPGSGRLRHGENTLRIFTPANAERNLDIIALNWFEVTYKRKYTASDSTYILFTGGDTYQSGYVHQIEVSGFRTPAISLYKKGISKMVSWDVDSNSFDGSYKITFQDAVFFPETEYIAVTEEAKMKPKSLTLDTLRDLRQGSHNARYLIITPKIFRNSVQRLENYRRSRGYTVETVLAEDIYDQFNAGIKSPYAIRDFLRFAAQSPAWQGTQGSPLYVVLIGDAAYNSKRSKNDFLPVQSIQTLSYGPAGSDHWYAALDDDIIADLFIGRISVTTNTELDHVIDKIITYEQSAYPGDWKNRVCFIGGQRETRGQGSNSEIPYDVFRYQSSRIINNRLPQRFSADRIYAYPLNDQFFGGANAVMNAFNTGKLLMAYLGHGGGGIWGDLDALTGKPLLSNDQALALTPTNGPWPLVLSMTCFVGSFEEDSRVALGELLLKTPNRGAIGVYAASGVGWIIGDYQLLDQTIQPMLEQASTAGEALTLGKLNYIILKGADDFQAGGDFGSTLEQAYIAPSMVYQFNFLGDPALRLKVPENKTLNLSNYSPVKTDTVLITGSAGFSAGTAKLEVYQYKPVRDSVTNGANIASLVTIYSTTFTITGNDYSVALNLSAIPDTLLADGFAGVRIYGESSDGARTFSASADFAVNATYISDIQTIPAVITSTDTIRFRCRANDPQGVDHVVALYERLGVINQTGLMDTLYPAGNQYYESRGIGPWSEKDELRFHIKVKDTTGDSTVTARYSNTVRAGIDLSLGAIDNPGNPLTDRIFLSGDSVARIMAVIENNGYLPVNDIPVKFYRNHPQLGGILIGETTTSIAGTIPNSGKTARDTVAIPAALENGSHNIYVWVDSAQSVNDVNRTNNLGYRTLSLNIFNVTPALGTTLSGIKNDTVFVDERFALCLPPASVTQPATIALTPFTNVRLVNQPDLELAILKNASAPAAYRIDFSRWSDVTALGKTMLVYFNYDTTRYPSALGYKDSLGVYRWDSGNQRWRLIGYDIGNLPGRVTVPLTRPEDFGDLTLMINRDRTGPVIEPNIEGQYFSQGAIVPKNPKISAVIYDRNGVSLLRSNYSVFIDQQPAAASNLILPDSSLNSNTVTLILSLPQTFTAGEHVITFQAADVNGNHSAITELRFNVITQFSLKVMGNFPNPFSNTTTLAFRVEAPETLDKLEVAIYTVSGRKIRSITSDDPVQGPPLNAIGYHEVIWDATDDHGHNVANGIYFYRIKGSLNGKTVEKRGKIAYFR